MENVETRSPKIQTEQIQYANKTESAENFQKFIYELFEKNGILNDLRAYLREHIVNVLKSSETDEIPSCQRHFTQRLEPAFQALNMLIAEYLLTMEFSYSLSVFVSEIPLANMVFAFARSLMDGDADGEAPRLRFKEADVWSILNYLGVKCDSDNANKVVEMYRTQNDSPLLLCILKCVQLHNMDPILSSASQSDSITSESKASVPELERPTEKCRHSAFCQNCHVRFNCLKEKYQRKKKHFLSNTKHPSLNPMNVEYVMKKIGSMERDLLEEMFDQLKSVYEAEVDMVRSEQDEKIKRSLANHALHFQERQNELEESYKSREMALEDNIEHKKRFLWGLAKALRRQHAQMAKAMQAVKDEAERLADKEKSLKAQLAEAEASLKRRGDEMRQQIAHELRILETHLESIKTERDCLEKERSQVDNNKLDAEFNIKAQETNEALKNQYALLKEEFNVLRKYLECTKLDSRCVVERGTVTDVSNADSRINVLNNNDVSVKDAPNRVVNDFKKQKNVNFSQSNIEATRSRPSFDDERAQIIEENERLRQMAAQQSQHMAELSARAARLQAALQTRRPRTAPPAPARPHDMTTTSSNTFGWSKGAGEELTFSIGQSPIVLPGQSVPFIGVVGQSRADRWRLLDQMRAIRRRASPINKSRRHGNSAERRGAGISFSSPPSTCNGIDENTPQESCIAHASRCNLRHKVLSETQPREKSPKSVLREAKEKLRTVARPSAAREPSPSAVLREAKLRLRKLEIEAEAVERSYIDFRRRQELRHSREETCLPSTANNVETRFDHKIPEQSESQPRDCLENLRNMDLDKYLAKYKEFDIGQTHFKNRNTVAEIKLPIPETFVENDRETVPKRDYLEQPLTEFRQLYCSKSRQQENVDDIPKLDIEEIKSPDSQVEERLSERRAELKQAKQAKEMELEILQQNISKIYDLHDEPTKETTEPLTLEDRPESRNLLKVEFENSNEIRDPNGKADENLLLVVASSAEPTDLDDSRSDVENAPPMTIIVSPKLKDVSEAIRPPSASQEQRIVEKDVFNSLDAGDQDVSSDNQDQDNLDTGGHYSGGDDYADDFSADVDNYTNKSEYDHDIHSPVSLPKSSEDENFWE